MSLVRLVSAYLYFFGLLHIVSVFFGMQIVQFGWLGSLIFLVVVMGLGTIYVTWVNSRPLLGAYILLYTVGFFIEFTEISQWVAPWRHDQYILLACMDAIAAICLIYLATTEKSE